MKSKAKPLRAVLFDMDGTLFDTERLYQVAWHRAGVPNTLYLQMIGRGHEEIVELLRKHLDSPPEELSDICHREMEKLLAERIPKKPGADEALAYLKQHGYQIALATSSFTARAQENLQRAGVAEFFDTVVGGDQITHGKPAPDIYLTAAAQLGRIPAECLVVEDSRNGLRSGRAAEMYTVLIPDLLPPDAEMKHLANRVLPSLRELPALVEQLSRP